MSTLVVYASKHGATQGIAERIAKKLTDAGQQADVRSAREVGDLEGYDSFVIGSAAYAMHWLKEASAFVRRNRSVLAHVGPVWLFSSGPLGNDATDAKGRDLRATTEPKEFSEFQAALQPRGCRVFFGALTPDTLGFGGRALRKLPAARAGLPEGDFRDWAEIDAWTEEIARDLAEGPVAVDRPEV